MGHRELLAVDIYTTIGHARTFFHSDVDMQRPFSTTDNRYLLGTELTLEGVAKDTTFRGRGDVVAYLNRFSIPDDVVAAIGTGEERARQSNGVEAHVIRDFNGEKEVIDLLGDGVQKASEHYFLKR